MDSNQNPQRVATRWKYNRVATIGWENGSKSKTKLLSISKSGISFQLDKELAVSTKLFIGWRDDQAGLIRGKFIIKRKILTDDNLNWIYGARYYTVDPDSKQNLLKIFKNLQTLKSHKPETDFQILKKIIDAQNTIFTKPLQNTKLQSLLDESFDPAIQACQSPKTPFEFGFQKMKKIQIQISLIYSFLENASKLSAEDINYCFSYFSNLLSDYMSLENQDLAVLDIENEAESEESEANIENKKRKLTIRKNLNHIYVSSTNDFFNISKKMVDALQASTYLSKVDNLKQQEVENIGSIQKNIVSYFKNNLDVSSEHISDMDMILTRSFYEVENNEKNKETVSPAIPKEEKGKNFRNQIILGFLILILLGALWSVNTTKNLESKYDKLLSLPVKIKKITQYKGQLQIQVYKENINDFTGEELSQTTKNIEQFLSLHKQYNLAILKGKNNTILRVYYKRL